ncbi:MAG: hypothetical protein ACHQ4H_19225 [Ktedonobacterales bacterium]
MSSLEIETKPMTATGTSGERRERRWRARIETVLIVAGLLALLLFLGHHVYTDAQVRYDELTALLHGQPSQGKFSLIGPIFSIPI